MTVQPRQEQILSLLFKLRQVSVSELTERLGVSQVTIRKDLTRLEEMGYVYRSHGSARLSQSLNRMPGVSDRSKSNQEAKNAIASVALSLIHEGDIVCLDAGSTNLALARAIRDIPLQVVTNSLDVVNVLLDSELITLTALGGNYRREAGSFIGPLTLDTLSGLSVDLAFIGSTGFTAQGEFFTQNTIEGSVKRAMLNRARRRVIVSDSSKLNARGFSRFAGPDLVDILISDSGLNETNELQRNGIEVLIGPDELAKRGEAPGTSGRSGTNVPINSTQATKENIQ